jgi:hypothetical protein
MTKNHLFEWPIEEVTVCPARIVSEAVIALAESAGISRNTPCNFGAQ